MADKVLGGLGREEGVEGAEVPAGVEGAVVFLALALAALEPFESDDLRTCN